VVNKKNKKIKTISSFQKQRDIGPFVNFAAWPSRLSSSVEVVEGVDLL
jgi:hypothetical protein